MKRLLLILLLLLPLTAHPQTIGLLATLTGDSAPIGMQCRDGYELARYVFARDDRALHLVFGDTKGQGAPAVFEFRKMIDQDKAIAVVAQRSQPVMAINPLSKAEAVPLFVIAGQESILRDNPFAVRFWPSTRREAVSLVEYVMGKGLRRVAAVSVEDEYTLSLKDYLRQELERKGGALVFDEKVSGAEQDFSSLVTRAKQLHPDTIFLNVSMEQLGTLAKEIYRQHLPGRKIVNIWGASPGLVENAGNAATEETVFAQVKWRQPEFIRLLKEYKGDVSTSAVGYCCFTALAALLQTVKEAGPGADRGKVVHALSSLREVRLPDGVLKIEDREAVYPVETMVIKGGRIEPQS